MKHSISIHDRLCIELLRAGYHQGANRSARALYTVFVTKRDPRMFIYVTHSGALRYGRNPLTAVSLDASRAHLLASYTMHQEQQRARLRNESMTINAAAL